MLQFGLTLSGLVLRWRVDKLDVGRISHPVFKLSLFVVRDVG